MNNTRTLIDTKQFFLITKDIKAKGSKCVLDKSIMNYLENTTMTAAGKELAEYLEEICESSEIHNRQISNAFPAALDKLGESMTKVENSAADSLKMI